MLQYIDALIAFSGVILLASMIVTILTQMVVTVLNLRGKNLLWGLSRLISEMEPTLKDDAEKIAKKVLQHPLICRSKKRLPNVIRVEEFSELFVKIAESPEDIKEFSQETQEKLKDLAKMDADKLAEQLEILPDKMEQSAQKKLKEVHEIYKKHLKQARGKIIELESWFDNVTDRISERFTLRSKLITVGGAVVVALVLQLDSIHLLRSVYTNAELRSRLLNSTDMFLQRGEEVTKGQNVFTLAMDSLASAIELPSRERNFYNRLSAEEWLVENLSEEQDETKVVNQYRELQKHFTGQKLGYLGDQLLALKSDLNRLDLPIFDEFYTWEFWKWKFTKYLGILVSIGLISLGAPFWFNLLKNLSNLRSRVMQNEEKERNKRKSIEGQKK